MLEKIGKKQQIALAAFFALLLMFIGYRSLADREDYLPLKESASSHSAEGNDVTAETPECLVHVCGAVLRPGVYRLKKGSRVFEAIEMAGGAAGWADLAALNLAASISDGCKVEVPLRGAATTTSGSAPKGIEGGMVNLNTADEALLDTLPGIGPATARRILEYRQEKGPFRNIRELMEVPGIGQVKFDRLKSRITLG